MAGLLLALRWKDRPVAAPPSPASRRALIVILTCMVAASALFHLLFLSNPDWRLLLWAFGFWTLICWALVCMATGGRGWVSHFFFPSLLLLTAIPWPTRLETPLIQHLLGWVTRATVELLLLLGIPAKAGGNVIILPSGIVGVEDACSGIRSFQLTLMAAVFIGDYYRLSTVRRMLTIALGVAVALVVNLGRTMGLTALYRAGGGTAVDRWHDHFGVVSALLALLAVWGIGRLLYRATQEPTAAFSSAKAPYQAAPDAGSPLPLSLLATLTAVFCLGHFGAKAHFLAASPGDPGPGTIETANWDPGPPYERIPIPAHARSALRFTRGDSWIGHSPTGTPPPELVAFHLVWEAGSISSMVQVHRPEICLPASGYRKVAEEPEEEYGSSASAPALKFRSQLFSDGVRTLRIFQAEGSRYSGGATSDSPNGAQRLRQALSGSRLEARWLIQIVLPANLPRGEAWMRSKAFLDAATNPRLAEP